MIYNMIYGGTSSPQPRAMKDINFFDYDGTIVDSYYADEWDDYIPPDPEHDGLISQGWNYTLAQIQAEVTAQGKCDIGEMYLTESGDTEIDIELLDGRTDPYLSICPNGTVTIDWGDGDTDTVTGTSLTTAVDIQHSYASAGEYTISLHTETESTQYGMAGNGNAGSKILWSNAPSLSNNLVYLNAVKAIRFASGVTINGYGLQGLGLMKYVTIPPGITEINANALERCYTLKHITFPNTVATLYGGLCATDYALESISIPRSVTRLNGGLVGACMSLKNIVIPTSVTSVGSSDMNGCNSLSRIVTPIVGSSMFSGCAGLESAEILYGATIISSTGFSSCPSLRKVIIPGSVTVIADSAFYSDSSLSKLTIPSSVTDIGAQAFRRCYGMKEYHFESTTPPTLQNDNAFDGIPSDCTIYVPSASENAYKTSWSTYASQIVGE